MRLGIKGKGFPPVGHCTSQSWKKWYAWYPVRVDKWDWRVYEVVWRRKHVSKVLPTSDGDERIEFFHWEYCADDS